MSASLPLILNGTVADSSATLFGVSVNSSTDVLLIVFSLVAVLFGVVGLYRRWKVTDDTSPHHDDQPLHGISEQKKLKILAEMESKQMIFKQRQELLAENRALKSQVYQQKKEISEIKDVKQKRDETIEQMQDKVNEVDKKNYVLMLELSELDHRLDLERKRLNETQVHLNETQVTLGETERELDETQRELEETAEYLQDERKLRMDLIEDYKHLESRLKEEQSRRRAMEASLRRELGQCQEEFERAKRNHKAAMDKWQSEKRALQEQINAYKKRQSELEEALKREKQMYSSDMKVMQDRLNKCIDENKGYKQALELINKEKASLMDEHKQLLRKFEAALKELDLYTDRLKPDSVNCPNPGQCLACKLGLEGRCTIKNVEYELKCSLCSWIFSGETKRPIRERIQEHRRAAQAKNSQNPVGHHFATKHSSSPTPTLPFAVNITGRAIGNIDR